MNLKTVAAVISLFFFSAFVSAQVPQQIEKTVSDIIISLSQDKTLSGSEFDLLDSILNTPANENDLQNKYLATKASFDSLKEQLAGMEAQLNNISRDSSLVLFNQFYLHFSATFYNYFKDKIFSSPKTKIIFFSASVSCPCTLEMCKNQLVDILKFRRNNGDKYDFWVIDSYWNNELQIKYDTFFAPSVLVLNSNNEIIHKIEYDEKMINNLTDFLTANN